MCMTIICSNACVQSLDLCFVDFNLLVDKNWVFGLYNACNKNLADTVQ